MKRLIVSGTADPLWTLDDRAGRSPRLPARADRPVGGHPEGAVDAEPTSCRRARTSRRTTSRCVFSRTRSCRRSICRRATRRPASAATRLITQGTGVDRGEIIGIDPGGYLDALNTLFRNQLPTWSVALNITYNLGTSAEDASIARARIQQNQIEVQLRQLDLQVTSDISNAAIQVENTAERVQAAQAARELAQQQLDAENSKFGVGMSTNYSVVLAQRDLATRRTTSCRPSSPIARRSSTSSACSRPARLATSRSFRDETNPFGAGIVVLGAVRRADSRSRRQPPQDAVTLDVVVTDAKVPADQGCRAGGSRADRRAASRGPSMPCALGGGRRAHHRDLSRRVSRARRRRDAARAGRADPSGRHAASRRRHGRAGEAARSASCDHLHAGSRAHPQRDRRVRGACRRLHAAHANSSATS